MYNKHLHKPLEKKLFTLIILFGITFQITAQNEGEKWVLSGYIKNLQEFSLIDQWEELKWTTTLHNRLNYKYAPIEEINVRVEVRNRLFYGDNVRSVEGFSTLLSQDDGMVDLSWNWIDNENLLLNTTVDRILIQYVKGNWDMTFGRQRVNWGMNLAWNPNDIFNTYNLLDFDYEERPGSDAIRVQYYAGDFSKIEVTVKKGNLSKDHIIAALYKFNRWSYDIQLIAGLYQQDVVIGTGWAGNLKEAGWKGEISYFIPYESYIYAEKVLSASTSLDYGFKNGLYVNGSVLYNSGRNVTSGVPEYLLATQLRAKYLMPFELSWFLQLAKEFSPLISASVSTIYSPTNQSFIFMPNLKYSLASNWEIDAIGQSFYEFEKDQNLGNRFFIRLRYSF